MQIRACCCSNWTCQKITTVFLNFGVKEKCTHVASTIFLALRSAGESVADYLFRVDSVKLTTSVVASLYGGGLSKLGQEILRKENAEDPSGAISMVMPNAISLAALSISAIAFGYILLKRNYSRDSTTVK